MQKRNQDFFQNQDEYFHPVFKKMADSPIPAKRARVTYSPEKEEAKTSMILLNRNEQKLAAVRKAPSTSPEPSYIRNESTTRSTHPILAESFAEKKSDSSVHGVSSHASRPAESPSITDDDDLGKRSAFREVSRSRIDTSCTNSQIHREHVLQQTNTNKYIQPRPCSSMYTEYPYLRNSFIPMALPSSRNCGAISTFPTLSEAARWQHAGVATAAHYASYYQQLTAQKPVADLKTESERYMERLIARERVQAESFALRCAVDKSTHPLSPTFGRRVADPLTITQPTSLVTFARPEDAVAVDPHQSFPWQRTVLSNAVYPLNSSIIDLPSENWCAKCNASFRMTSDLVYHMRTHHKRNSVEDPDSNKRREEKLKCNICNETFRERHHLTRHMTSHVNG